MRNTILGALCAGLLGVASTSQAAIYSYKASAGPNASPDANSGTVNVWTVVASTTNTSNAGSFQGDSATNGSPSSGAGAGASAWALYANSGNNIRATANLTSLIGADGPIDLASESIRIQFDNGFIDNTQSVTLEFLNGANTSVARVRFSGGDNQYRIDDSVNSFGTAIPFTADGFTVAFSLNNTLGSYDLQIGASTFSGRTLASGATSIAAVSVFNNNAGNGGSNNLYFDNLVINAIPEPGAFLFGGVASILAAVAYRRRK